MKQTTKMNNCRYFKKWTHPTYEDAGCYGCSHFFIFTSGDIVCEFGNDIEMSNKICKAFGFVTLVVKYGD
jgi:hypothetical protein